MDRTGWLRAAVFGANDGLVSVGSLVLGVAASQASHSSVLVAGIAAWIAGVWVLSVLPRRLRGPCVVLFDINRF